MKHFIIAAAFALFLAASCTPVRQGSSDNAFYSTGQPNIRVQVAEPLKLAVADTRWVSVPTNVAPDQPYTQVSFAAYTADKGDAVTLSAHVIIGNLPADAWQFTPESWKGRDTFMLSNDNIINGKRWTVQMKPVVARSDWFSDLWQANNRRIPTVWLAKRWSSNPVQETRIVAEYREAAPQCVITAMTADTPGAGAKTGIQPADASMILARCRAEIDAFEARANGIFTLDALTSANTPVDAATPRFALPASNPDVRKLVGEVEPIEHSSLTTR